MGADDEGQWQPMPSQAEGDREEDEGEAPQPIPSQPAEGGRDAVGDTTEGGS